MSHPGHLMESWKANIDFQLMLCIDKVLKNVSKCVTNHKNIMTKVIACIVKNNSGRTKCSNCVKKIYGQDSDSNNAK